ncbi:MAG: hypothetical protein ACLSFT_04035 [Ruminococcus callidus]
MNILIDAFGGDNAPLEVIRGGARAVQELGVTVTLVGTSRKFVPVPRKTGCRWTAWKFCMLRQCSTFTRNPRPC